jgi:iron-sulfur cluster protein
MAEKRYQRLYEKIDQAIREKSKRAALYRAMQRGRDSRQRAIRALPGGAGFRDEVRAIKLRCLDAQDSLVERFADKARERGATVFMAEDSAAAIRYVLEVADACGAKTVAKSKSLTSEEIEINHPLESAGLDVIETDLGELIIQKVHEKPFHLVFPAVHKTVEEVAEIFRQETGEEIPADADAIMKVVRRYLRPVFLNADIGMTGANVGIAENGAIVMETNEGNARLVSSIPDVHICIMGREKVVESIEDALQMMMAHPLSAVGQPLTTYVTLMAGRSPLGEGEGQRESHLVILDNGRTRMREDPLFQDSLNCIRCAACMNICPTYGVVGGHTFGYIYPGPIGIPWTAQVHGLELAGDFAPLCISCGLCKEICPVKIDIPMMIAAVKDRDAEIHPQPIVNRVMMAAEPFAKFGSATAPISNRLLQNRAVRWMMEKTLGIDRRRVLPHFSRPTLAQQMERRGPSTVHNPRRRVAFFADLFANYNAPDLGMKAIRALEALGCEVVMPSQMGCGYQYLAYGNLKAASKAAEKNVCSLAQYVEQGYDVVAMEPTATYCLREAYLKLLDHRKDAEAVSGKTFELFEYLGMLEESVEVPLSLQGQRFGFHISCHQRPLGGGRHAIEYLRRRGAEVEVIETGTCCGMGGTFGLKAGLLGYDLSQAVGEPLFDAFRQAAVTTIVTESSVCTIQLKEGTGLPVRHPLELLEDSL